MRAKWVPVFEALEDGERNEKEIARDVPQRADALSRTLNTLRDKHGFVELVGNGSGPARRIWRLTQDGRMALHGDGAGQRLRAAPGAARQSGGEAPDETSGDAGGGPPPVGSSERASVIAAHQSFVATRLSSEEVPDLLEVLATGQTAAERATAVARLDGEAHNYLFLFDAEGGAAAAERLSVVLRRRQLRFTLGTVADVRTFAAMLAERRSSAGLE